MIRHAGSRTEPPEPLEYKSGLTGWPRALTSTRPVSVHAEPANSLKVTGLTLIRVFIQRSPMPWTVIFSAWWRRLAAATSARTFATYSRAPAKESSTLVTRRRFEAPGGFASTVTRHRTLPVLLTTRRIGSSDRGHAGHIQPATSPPRVIGSQPVRLLPRWQPEFVFGSSGVNKLARVVHGALRDHTIELPDDPDVRAQFLATRLVEIGPGQLKLATRPVLPMMLWLPARWWRRI